MKIAHLTTVDMSLRYLVLPQLEAAKGLGESIGISAPGEYVVELEERGIRHVALPSSTRGMSIVSDLRAALDLFRILRREQVDVLHTHNPKPGVYGRIVGRLAGVPMIVNTIHGLYATEDSPRLKRWVVYFLEWLAARFSDAELIQSPEDYELLMERGILPAHKTRFLGNGVDLSRFNPERAGGSRVSLREELGAAEDEVVVGMVGRLVAEKGVPELIAAAKQLGDGYRVVVVGPLDPDKPDALAPELIEEGERAGVRFLGMRRDVDLLYGAFDLFVLPSHREGFPRAAMEAAASGLPVVATDIRGCRQVVDEGVNGLLFPKGDVASMVDAIRQVGGDLAVRERMGAASAVKAAADFDEQRVVEKVMDAYMDLARERGLAWAALSEAPEPIVRPARIEERRAIAELHKRAIGSGFLSSLGVGFLSLLYRALIDSPDAAVFVAESRGVVVGFIAGTADTGDFYRSFLRSNGPEAVVRLAPAMIAPATLKSVYETLRYGSEDPRAPAELLSMAVAPAARRMGLGRKLVERLLEWADERAIDSMKVVVGAGNSGAIRLYNACGFLDGRDIEVHEGSPSKEFIWTRS